MEDVSRHRPGLDDEPEHDLLPQPAGRRPADHGGPADQVLGLRRRDRVQPDGAGFADRAEPVHAGHLSTDRSDTFAPQGPEAPPAAGPADQPAGSPALPGSPVQGSVHPGSPSRGVPRGNWKPYGRSAPPRALEAGGLWREVLATEVVVDQRLLDAQG